MNPVQIYKSLRQNAKRVVIDYRADWRWDRSALRCNYNTRKDNPTFVHVATPTSTHLWKPQMQRITTYPYDCTITYRHRPSGRGRDKRRYHYLSYVRASSKVTANSTATRAFMMMFPNSIVTDVSATKVRTY